MKLYYAVRLCSLFITIFILCGCGTLANGKRWGEDATIYPGWDKMSKAAYNSIVSPFTWVPITGAAIVQIGNWDHNISNWASENTPIFGSRSNAYDWSNYLLYTSGTIYAATALLTPSGGHGSEWITDKMKGFIVGGAAIGFSEGIVVTLQPALNRGRPDGSRQSFPSGHATAAASFSTLASKNIGAMQPTRDAEIAANSTLVLVTAGTAWARVEAKKHYPGDILAGMAIGHFISAFVNEAFLGIDNSKGIIPTAEISKNEYVLSVKGSF